MEVDLDQTDLFMYFIYDVLKIIYIYIFMYIYIYVNNKLLFVLFFSFQI
jgi:hypothetical protein